MNYKLKYLKYKKKYINLKNIQGGASLAGSSTSKSRARFKRRSPPPLIIDEEDTKKKEEEEFLLLKNQYENDEFIEFTYMNVNETGLTRLSKESQGNNSVMFRNNETRNLVKRINKKKLEEVKILIKTMKSIKQIFESGGNNCCFIINKVRIYSSQEGSSVYIIDILMNECTPFNLNISDDNKVTLLQNIKENIELLHKNNIIHRDIKLANIVYCGNKWILIDLNDATHVDDFNKEKYRDFRTYGYWYSLSPENETPEKETFENLKKLDWYAYGVTFLRLFHNDLFAKKREEDLYCIKDGMLCLLQSYKENDSIDHNKVINEILGKEDVQANLTKLGFTKDEFIKYLTKII